MYSGRLDPSEDESGICFSLSSLVCEISSNYKHPDIITSFSNLFPDEQALQVVDISYRILSISTFMTPLSSFSQFFAKIFLFHFPPKSLSCGKCWPGSSQLFHNVWGAIFLSQNSIDTIIPIEAKNIDKSFDYITTRINK